jgi:hypothetical protein
MGLTRLRTRFAALVLLLASPGMAGLAVDAAHPCPEKAPWTVESPGGHHHHDQAPAERHDCHCVGACQTAVALSISVRDLPVLEAPLATEPPASFLAELVPLGRPRDRLPPATAPPIV